MLSLFAIVCLLGVAAGDHLAERGRLFQCSYFSPEVYEVFPDSLPNDVVMPPVRRLQIPIEPTPGGRFYVGNMYSTSVPISACYGIATDPTSGTVYVVVGNPGLLPAAEGEEDTRRLQEGGSGPRFLGVLDTTTLSVNIVGELPSNTAGLTYDYVLNILWGVSGGRDDINMPGSTLFQIIATGSGFASTLAHCTLEQGSGRALSFLYGSLVVFTEPREGPEPFLEIVRTDNFKGTFTGDCFVDRAGIVPQNLAPKLVMVEARNGYSTEGPDTTGLPGAFGSDLSGTIYAMRPEGDFGSDSGSDSSASDSSASDSSASDSDDGFPTLSLTIVTGPIDGPPGPMSWVGFNTCTDTLPSVYWDDQLGAPVTPVACPTCTFATITNGLPVYFPPGPREAYIRRGDCGNPNFPQGGTGGGTGSDSSSSDP